MRVGGLGRRAARCRVLLVLNSRFEGGIVWEKVPPAESGIFHFDYHICRVHDHRNRTVLKLDLESAFEDYSFHRFGHFEYFVDLDSTLMAGIKFEYEYILE